MKIGVLGAGALGLTAGHQLAKKGHQVVVIEKAEGVGGLVSSIKIGDSYLERFYHHIFQTDKEIISLIKEVGLEDKLEWKRPITSTYYQGKVYQFDSPLSVLRFSPLPFMNRIKLGLAVFYLKIKNDYSSFEDKEAKDWIIKWMGEKAWEIVWGPLFKGKFSSLAGKVTMSWFWSRVHVRTASLGYLKGGFYPFYLRLAEQIESWGGEIQTGQEVTEIRESRGKVKVFTKISEFEFDKLLVTIPTTLFFNLAKLPTEYKEKYAPPLHYGALNTILFLKKRLTDIYWLNISDESFPFLVLVEHTNFRDIKEYANHHLVYLGNYLPVEDPKFKKSDEEILQEYLPYLQKINPNFDQSWVEKVVISRAPFAQPVVTKGYKKKLPPYLTPLKNVYLANMSQVYPEDRGQNYSIKLALEVVAKYFS